MKGEGEDGHYIINVSLFWTDRGCVGLERGDGKWGWALSVKGGW